MRPVLLECLERQRRGYQGTALGLTMFAVWQRMGPGQVDYPASVFGFLAAGVLPALPHERLPVWDAAMPVDRARYALVRLICGVVRAAFILAVVTGLYAALFADPEHPGWYPLALFAWGLTAHLLVSATFLSVIGPAVALGLGVLIAVQLLPGSSVDPAELRQMGVWEVLARTALPLGLAGAAAYVVTRFPARSPEPADPAAPHARAPRRNPVVAPNPPAPFPERPAPLPDRSAPARVRRAPPPVRRAGLARPSATLTVFRRHFALLLPFTIVPALTLLVGILMAATEPILDLNQAGEGPTLRSFVKSTELGGVCAWIALSWSVLVWLAERGPRRRWNDTLPVGTVKRRILHATAGAAWLLLFLPVLVAAPLRPALAAGLLATPAEVPAWLWLGLPVRTLTLYLAATFVLFGVHVAFHASSLVTYVLVALKVDRVVPLMIILMMIVTFAVPYGSFVLGVDLLESLARDVVREAESHADSVLWLVVYAAAAAGVIALNDWIRRLERLPTVREVRGFLHGWADTRPNPPLPGHARR